MSDRDFLKQLSGYSLTTAEILYRLPDYPALLQTYLWQDYDVCPQYPKLKSFLDFWSANLDGALYKIRIAHVKMLHPREVAFRNGEFSIN